MPIQVACLIRPGVTEDDLVKDSLPYREDATPPGRKLVIGEEWRRRETESADKDGTLKLVCPLCREVYLVGKDACIVSLGNALAFMAGQGTAIIGDADGMMAATPDLVGRILPGWGKGEREEKLRETQANVERIRSSIKSGQRPQWQCHTCQDKGHPNPYPKDF